MRRIEKTVGLSERKIEAVLSTMPSSDLCQRVKQKLDLTSSSLAQLMSHFKVTEGPSANAKEREEDTESVSSADSAHTMVPASAPATPGKKGPTSMSAVPGPSIGLHMMVHRKLEEGLAFQTSPSASPPISPYIWKRRGAPRVQLGSTEVRK
jgi:hypothetical protein